MGLTRVGQVRRRGDKGTTGFFKEVSIMIITKLVRREGSMREDKYENLVESQVCGSW